jgi:hypothetical protein
MEFAFNPVRQGFSNGINRPKRTDDSYSLDQKGRSFLIPAKEMAYA